jgi:hypothetical protein
MAEARREDEERRRGGADAVEVLPCIHDFGDQSS